MRFMLLMIPHGYETAAPDTIPDDVEAVGAMMAYNESMQKAGILISCDGLHPPSMGARVSFPGRKPKVVDGPFAEEGSARRLLDHRRALACRCHRMGHALPRQ